MSNSNALRDLHKQQSLIRDRVRQVAKGNANGMYLHGRPGISKTYLVRTTLEALGFRYAYDNGHLTPVGLFDLIAVNPKSVIVLDDVTEIFRQPIALQILLAALGTPHDGSRSRMVTYKSARIDQTVRFEGGIIAISNLSLEGHENKELAALNDRVHVIAYNATDEQIEDQIIEIASSSPKGIGAKDARTVARYLIDECRQVNQRLSIRLYMDKALPDFDYWKSGGSELHWQDLVRSSIQQEAVSPQHELRDVGRKDRIESEQRVAFNIYESFDTHAERVAAWQNETRKSAGSFNRRINELKKLGRLVTLSRHQDTVLSSQFSRK